MTTQAELRALRMASRSPTPSAGEFPVWTVEKLRFADTDRNGHITNSVFAVCCQNARMELLCDPKRVPIPRNTQFLIARLVLDFRAEMHWPGSVQIGTRVESIGQSSVTLAQGLFVNQRCVASAESIVVLTHVATRRSVNFSEEVVQAFRGLGRPHREMTPNRTTSDATL